MFLKIMLESFHNLWQYWNNVCASSCCFDFPPTNVVIRGIALDMKCYCRVAPVAELLSCIIVAYCTCKKRSSSLQCVREVTVRL
jgi:hypothetical protein